MDRHNRYLNQLKEIAKNIDPAASARLAAYIVYKNTIIAIGINKNKTHPLQKQFGKNSKAIYIHAEIDAINNTLRNFDKKILEKSVLYICRVKRSGIGSPFQVGLAKPCEGCMRAIFSYGLKKAYYSISDNEYGVIDNE